jgi:N-acyl-D-aspartate/D-glutamate deacylase
VLFVGVACLSATAVADGPRFDLVIRGGRVVDGTGNPWFTGDVAVTGGRIVAVGEVATGAARREIDAAGLVVAPGFIDMHSHSDWSLFTDGDAQSKIRQGVTTDILGEGSSGGPNTGRLAPKKVEVRGRTVAVESLGDYFAALEESGTSINVASYVGLGNLWQSVMGESFERPTPAQLMR